MKRQARGDEAASLLNHDDSSFPEDFCLLLLRGGVQELNWDCASGERAEIDDDVVPAVRAAGLFDGAIEEQLVLDAHAELPAFVGMIANTQPERRLATGGDFKLADECNVVRLDELAGENSGLAALVAHDQFVVRREAGREA